MNRSQSFNETQMAVLLHITDAKSESSIRRQGLKAGRRGVYALPVTGDFIATHQWARELKRRGWHRALAVYFRMPGATPVRAGRYNEPHEALSLGAAIAGYLARGQPCGYEIIFATKVPRRSILKTKPLHRPPGWRYFPEAKGRTPVLGYSSRGGYAAARLRRRLEPPVRLPPFEELKAVLEASRDRREISEALDDLASRRRRASCAFLEPILAHPEPEVLLDLVQALASFTDPLARTFLERLAGSSDPMVREAARWRLETG